MKTLIAAVALLVVASNASAEGSVYLGGWSKHLASAHATNETHDFLVLEYKGYVAGEFINSYGYKTEIVGKKFNIDMLSTENFKTSVGASVTHGYKNCLTNDQPKDASAKYCFDPIIEVQYTKYRIVPTGLLIPGGVVLAINVKF